MRVLIVTGPSASGKTTFVNILKQQLVGSIVLSMDQYYLTQQLGEELDWDDPSALDLELLVNDVRRIIAGEEIYAPTYDFEHHQQSEAKVRICNPPTLIIEGIFALCEPRLREISDLSIYIDADPIKICLKRRIERDVLERHRSVERVIQQYFAQVYPGYEKYTLPSRRYADLCYLNEGEIPSSNSKIVKIILAYIQN